MLTIEITAVVLLVIANGIFAMSEIAVISARKARLEARAEEGSKRACMALDLAGNSNDFLSTVQIGLTLIGTLAGAVGGATLAAHMTAYLDTLPWIAPHGRFVAFAVVVIGISYLSLVVGELVPKRLALSHPERYAAALAPLMRRLSKLASPAVRFVSWSTDLVFRMIPIKHEKQEAVTEEEVRHMMEEGTETGAFEEAEQEMVEGVFRFGDRRVSELMTPRQEVVWIDLEDATDQVRQTLQQSSYTRFPVAVGDLDHLEGYVHVKDLLNELLSGKPFDIRPVVKQAPVVPESARALGVLETLRASNSHLAFVVDEHGGIEGLVTVTDLLQAIVGDVPNSSPSNEDVPVRREDGSWLIDGTMPAYEFKELLEIRKLPGETEGAFTSVGGFVMTFLGKVPKTGDHFEHGGWRFEVMDMDGNRVDKVLVSAVPQPEPGEIDPYVPK
jgi:putative hemolysin